MNYDACDYPIHCGSAFNDSILAFIVPVIMLGLVVWGIWIKPWLTKRKKFGKVYHGSHLPGATIQRRITILSLDDNLDVLEILSTLLQARGCNVLTTTDSYEAWALLVGIELRRAQL